MTSTCAGECLGDLERTDERGSRIGERERLGDLERERVCPGERSRLRERLEVYSRDLGRRGEREREREREWYLEVVGR
jgi:hypothetical protein